jgi:3-oxoacyl-[acyl-carrier protein] reductase
MGLRGERKLIQAHQKTAGRRHERRGDRTMDLQLIGKRALVTGSSSGLGAASAIRLAAEGCLVVVHGRNRRRTQETAADIAEGGGKVEVVFGDLEKDEDAARVAEEAVAAFGGIDILIKCRLGYSSR